MQAAARRRADVAPGQLDPGMRRVVARLLRQPDHELGLLALLAQQAALSLTLARAGDVRTPVGAASPDVTGVLEAVARLAPPEQRAAARLIREFLAYVEARGGLAGLV